MAKKRNQPKKSSARRPASRLKARQLIAAEHRLDMLYRQVCDILATARNRAWQAVNTAMVEAYWDVGRVIVEEEQAGRERADYGKKSEAVVRYTLPEGNTQIFASRPSALSIIVIL